jgi:hypothetical protein
VTGFEIAFEIDVHETAHFLPGDASALDMAAAHLVSRNAVRLCHASLPLMWLMLAMQMAIELCPGSEKRYPHSAA